MGRTFGSVTTINIHGSGGIIRPGGVALPRSFTARVEVEGSPVVATLEISIDADGRAGVDTLQLAPVDGASPLTTVGLRSIRLAELVRIAVAAAAERVEVGPEGVTPLPMSWADVDAIRRSVRMRRGPGTGPDAEAVEQAARIYRSASAAEEPPLAAVMRELGLARSTASRLIRAARDKKMIPPARKGDR